MPRRPFDSYSTHVACWLAEAGRGLAPDREQAERFLNALDFRAAFFSFRSFSDTPYTRLPGRDPLERAIHGSLADCWPELCKLNRLGAAIAVTINATNGQGRGKTDIQRVRALFLDDDRPDLHPGDFPLPPHMRVQSSSGRFHHYWLVQGVSLQVFQGLQCGLAETFHADLKACALNQAMALPGFWRRKQATGHWCTRLVDLSAGRLLRPDEVELLFRIRSPGP